MSLCHLVTATHTLCVPFRFMFLSIVQALTIDDFEFVREMHGATLATILDLLDLSSPAQSAR